MITIFDLFHEKDITEQEHILRYFYLIDTEELAHSISAKLAELKTAEATRDLTEQCDVLFQTIFDQIYTYAYQYIKFIPTETFRDAFFGEPYYCTENSRESKLDQYSKLYNLAWLQKLALYNFCVSEGFFYFLEKEYLFQQDDSSLPLKTSYSEFFNSGFFSNKKCRKNEYKTINSDSYIFQNFYNRKRKLRNADKNSFLYFIMNECCFNIFQKNKPFFEKMKDIPDFASSFDSFKVNPEKQIYVPLIYKFPIYTYFDINSIDALNRNLSKNQKGNRYTFNNYKKLYEEITAKIRIQKNSSLVDDYIFQTLNERYFGFSTFSYITQLLDKIYNIIPPEKSKTGAVEQTETNAEEQANANAGKQVDANTGEYADANAEEQADTNAGKQNELHIYNRSAFDNVLKNLSTCPLVYSRSLFLSYALEALKYSDHPETKYLKFSSSTKIGKSIPSKELSESLQISRKVELIESYFSTMNQIVLPLFSALWKVTLCKLEKSSLFGADNKLTNYFENYITNHFALLTFDFTRLSEVEIAQCIQPPENQNSSKENQSSKGNRSSKNNWSDFIASVDTLCKNKYCEYAQKAPYWYEYKKDKPFPNSTIVQQILYDFLLAPCRKQSRNDTYQIFSYISEATATETTDVKIKELDDFHLNQARSIFNLFS